MLSGKLFKSHQRLDYPLFHILKWKEFSYLKYTSMLYNTNALYMMKSTCKCDLKQHCSEAKHSGIYGKSFFLVRTWSACIIT